MSNKFKDLDEGPCGRDVAKEVHAAASGIVLVAKRALYRGGLAKTLAEAINTDVTELESTEDWLGLAFAFVPSLVVISCDELDRCQIEDEIRASHAIIPGSPIVVLADGDDRNDIVSVFRHGAKGYIPTSLPITVAAEALRLVRAGGTYAPVRGLLDRTNCAADDPASDIQVAAPARVGATNGQPRQRDDAIELGGSDETDRRRLRNDIFTPRQKSVVRAICQGKPNKVIAYELNMRESTVKVHVRSIMKKLNAKNRTEVACIAHQQII